MNWCNKLLQWLRARWGVFILIVVGFLLAVSITGLALLAVLLPRAPRDAQQRPRAGVVEGLNKTTELNKAAELEKARAEEAKCSDEISAFVMSQEFVKDQLKAPSTAKFPWMSNSQVSVKYLGDCVYEISAYVDSQNSFGAMLRSRYYAKLQNRRGTDSWSALAIRIE